jgi:uncharacterized phage protein (TIGR02218 family)
MKVVTPELSTHLGGETTTLCRLLRIDRTDGLILRFTDFDRDIFHADNSGVPVVAALWSPNVAEVAPWWITTGDSFSYQAFNGDVPNSHIFSVPADGTFLQSQIFAGNLGAGNATFLGTTPFSKGVTFETFVGLQADTLGAAGGLQTGLSSLFGWSSVGSYIGFEGLKAFDAAWGTWKLRMCDGVTVTLIDSGVSVFNAVNPVWNAPRVKLSFVVSTDGTSVTWYVNDILVGSASTSVPTAGMALSSIYTSTTGFGSTFYRCESVAIKAPDTSGGTYISIDGLSISAIQHKDDGSPNNGQVTGFLDDSQISEKDIRARLFDNATVELSAVNWADTTQGNLKLLKGTVGDIVMTNGAYQIELRGLTQKLTTLVGSTYGPVCRAELFGGGAEGIDPSNHWKCRLNRADWVQTGSVGSSPDSVSVVPNSSGSPAISLKMVGSSTPTVAAPTGWFDDGMITFTSGELNGYSFEVASWDGSTLTLFSGSPMPFTPTAGDTFEVEPGCDKTKPTCHSKFGNIVNFAGEADIPGLNVIGAISRAQIKD